MDSPITNDINQNTASIMARLLEENKRLDEALRRIGLYKGFEPAKDFDHCILLARYALYPEIPADPGDNLDVDFTK